MNKPSTLTIENMRFDPRSHMVKRLIFNDVTDAEVLISITDKLLGLIGEKGLFDKSTSDERSLSNWCGDMVEKLMIRMLIKLLAQQTSFMIS